MAIFDHVLVPVVTDEDAHATCDALEPYLDDLERVTAIHVIEKAGGGIDKAPLEKREEDAAEFLAIVDSRLGGSGEVTVDTQTVYGTDIVDTLFETAVETEADAVAIRVRGGGRLMRLLTGDVPTELITDPIVPVISLPRSGE